MYLNKAFQISCIVPSAILIPVFAVLLWKVKHGSDYKFVKNVVWLLLISNLSLIGFSVS